MILAGLRQGDVVEVDVRGLHFNATVRSVEPGQVWVDPPRNISYRLLTARQVRRVVRRAQPQEALPV